MKKKKLRVEFVKTEEVNFPGFVSDILGRIKSGEIKKVEDKRSKNKKKNAT